MKNIDKKFEKIGFTKIKETAFGAVYERVNTEYKYIQALSFTCKGSGYPIVKSYDKNLFDEKQIGNTCVGLTMYELKLCYKKMKQMGL